MAERTRYRQERTLARSIRPLPGQNRAEFKANVHRLKKHCRQFNADVAAICQWLMRYRPDGKDGSPTAERVWKLFFDTENLFANLTEADADKFRLDLADHLLQGEIAGRSVSPLLSAGVRTELQSYAGQPPTEHARRLAVRMRSLDRAHRMVLVKAAVDLIGARYIRIAKNHEEQFPHWDDERKTWEAKHPELTPEVCERLTGIFREMKVTRKSPRICTWELLSQIELNCQWAGERVGKVGHAPLCKKYRGFVQEELKGKLRKSEKLFRENAGIYLKARRERRLPLLQAMQELVSENRARTWFQSAWIVYLSYMGLNEETILKAYEGKLPHCLTFGDNVNCRFNPHTALCEEYRRKLMALSESDRVNEGVYREWRRSYLSGPKKPSFRYPSSVDLTVPKIFGAGYHEIDFEQSTLRLRLDDMPAGDWLEFAFEPWPSDYDRQPESTTITSVSIHFIGNRPRVNFRFEVPHRESRFSMSQDQIDVLRSREFPRQHQDNDFLAAARELLLQSWNGGPKEQIRILGVDLGETGASSAVFEGRDHQKDIPLKVVKRKWLYFTRPKSEVKQQPKTNPSESRTEEVDDGLTKEHVARHRSKLATQAREIEEHRPWTLGSDTFVLHKSDLRRPTRHVTEMMRDWVRLNAHQIIAVAEENKVDLIVFESMRGFKIPDYDDSNAAKKLRVAFLAYGRIRRKVAEKAVERGMRMVTVPYLDSSQRCSKCGEKQQNIGLLRKNKGMRRFACDAKNCGAELGSDANAARVLVRVFWGDILLLSTH